MTTPQTTTKNTRLGPGELRRMVAEYLLNSPVPCTTVMVANALGRSSGSVAYSLESLVKAGLADLVNDQPNTYAANDKTAQAAAQVIGAAAAQARPIATSTAQQAVQAPAPVNGPVRRPNGDAYHPRKLAGLSDVEALRKLREAGVAALLYGPPGTGKTSLVEAAYPDLITVAGDGDTEVADFIGEYVQTPDGRYEFVYGPLVRAMQEGRTLFIDDATLISPKVLAVVYPAMDGRREIVVKAHQGEVIKAAPGFYVVAGHNPGVHGAVLTEALASRFAAHIKVSSDYDLAKKLDINPKAVRVARNLDKRWESGEIGWAPQLRELIAFAKIESVLGVEAAVANLIGIAPEEDRDVVTEVVQTVFGSEYEPLALGQQV